ncbi:MAG TPA: MFS transporter [Candidatus Sumerlaeota bacterium]|nr:MFS transporter [Candidatus Sumerlaeota bacterium]
MFRSSKLSLRRHERFTLNRACAGEFGRGIYAALALDFTLTIAMTHYRISDIRYIWLLSAAPFIGHLTAVFATSLTARYRKKALIFLFEVLSRLAFITAALVTTGPLFVVFMALGMGVNALSVPMVSGMYGSNFTAPVRGWAMGRLQAISVGTTSAVATVTGILLGYGTEYFVFLLSLLSLLSLGCSWYNLGWPEPHRRVDESVSGHSIFRDFFQVLLTDRAFVYLEVVWFIIGSATLSLQPMRVLHLEQMGYDARAILVATTATTMAAQLLAVGMWGRILYKINIALYRALISLSFVVGMGLFFYARHYWSICLGSVIWGIALAGGVLSWRLIATFFTVPSRVPVYMSVHTFLFGLRGLIGPFFALRIQETSGVYPVANWAIAAQIVSAFLLLPLIPVMRARQAETEALVAATRPERPTVPHEGDPLGLSETPEG